MKKIIVLILAIASGAKSGYSQWSQIYASVGGIKSAYFLNSDTGFVAGANNVIAKTTDGGTTWTTVHSSIHEFQDICFPAVDTGFAAGTSGDFYRSTDEGNTWVPMVIPGGYTFYGMDFVSHNTGFLCGQLSGAGIMKTTDAGSTWSTFQIGGSTEFSAIDMVSPMTGFATGFDFSSAKGLFAKTLDGGTTWDVDTLVLPTYQLYLFGIHFLDDNTGFLTGHTIDGSSVTSAVVYKTTDGGATWNHTFLPTASRANDIKFVNSQTGYIGGNLAGTTGCQTSVVFKTTDGGNNWAAENTGPLIYGIGSLCFPNDSVGYAIESCLTGIAGILKYEQSVNCFAHYTVSVDSATFTFTLTVDSISAAQAVGYSWDFGDGTTSTSATPTYFVSVDTAYDVCMKIYTAAGDSCMYCHLIGKDYLSNIIRDAGFTIVVENPGAVTTAITDSGTQAFRLYPNPVDASVHISLNSLNLDTRLTIWDLLGRAVYMKELSAMESDIDLTEFSSGLYIFEVSGNSGSSKSKLLKK
jgi:photosystem II stability/assembly factor-like uncharacterized protein